MQISPDLKDIEDPIPFLHFFPERARAVIMSVQGQPIKKQSVEQYLCSIGQIFASVGANDPLHNRMGKINFWMGLHLESYHKEDHTPTRVRLLPVIVIQALDTTAQGTTAINISIRDLTWVALFSLLHPGEYCRGSNNTAQHPLRLKAV